MLDVAPRGLLRVNRSTDTNRLNELLTFMSNTILKSGRKYLGCGNQPNSMYQGRMSEQRSLMLDMGRPYRELKCRERAAFRHEMKFLRENVDQLHSLSILKLQRGECNDFWKAIKALNPKNKSMPLTVRGTSGDSNIASLFKYQFRAIENSVVCIDNCDQVMNALGTVPGHNDVINIHELRKIVRGLKNKKAVGNNGIPSEVYKFASE